MGVLSTPLGKDVLNLVRVDMNEGLSELFEIRIEAISDQPDIDFNKILGRNCSVALTTYKGRKRFFNGICCEGQWIGMRDDYHAYRIVLRPWLWLLTQTNDCKIFHKKSVVDIVKEVFSKAGFTDFEDKLSATYHKIHYCVQYRESKFAFVSRLMEEEGIYYYFEHSEDKHKLVLADGRSSHKALPQRSIMTYHPLQSRTNADEEYLGSWMTERRFRTGKVTLADYNFKTPNADMVSFSEATSTYQHPKLEVYDYPGRYPTKGKGSTRAKVKLEARQALDKHKFATGEAPRLFPGALFTLEKHINAAQNKTYLVLRASHSYIAEAYRSGGGSMGSEDAYSGNYEVLDMSIPYRPAITTPRPLIHGPQTAVVVGAKGEEIDVDEFGRILVKFHWDRDSDISCRVRLGNLWSGKNWGSVFIPRIGMEVIVEFLEGDPDRPLVTGTVYNANNMVPWKLPDEKNIAGIKSDSTKGGGGYNEFKFNDTKGSEKITKRAEKDMDVEVRDKETRVTGEIFKTPVGSPSRETTLKNGDDKLTVEKGDQNVKIGNNQKIDVTNEIEIKAGMKITLVVGGSKITIDPASITLEATMINIKAGAMLEAKSPMTTVKGDGILTLKGGMVLIN
jgi:type VI secretion system secreted protein VgrG